MNTKAAAPIALTCGEPAGIGPELAAMAWDALKADLCFAFIGDPAHLPDGTVWQAIDDLSEAQGVMPRALPVLPLEMGSPRQPGRPNPEQAPYVAEAIRRATALALAGKASAICTLPIHKKALQDGTDFAFPGHTEFLGELCGLGPEAPVMMLASPLLRVVPATVHIPLAKVPSALTPERLRHVIEVTHLALQTRFKLSAPRIAIAGLNPHAGEGGAIGLEEEDWINDHVKMMRAEGFELIGPLPADTMFHAAARAQYDAAIAMYHDQALIPIKTLDFDRGVNITLGLPIIRTSPDHGTAFDIAGKGRSNPSSTIEALRLAWDMATP